MYKKVKAEDLPKRDRRGESRFERTPEWANLKADIDKGLKPKDALVVGLTDADKERYGIQNRRTIARFVQKYLAENDIPYRVKSQRKDEMDLIIVSRD